MFIELIKQLRFLSVFKDYFYVFPSQGANVSYLLFCALHNPDLFGLSGKCT